MRLRLFDYLDRLGRPLAPGCTTSLDVGIGGHFGSLALVPDVVNPCIDETMRVVLAT
jgi:hypothetical protein